MEELISVIVPVYNTEKYLEKCLTSIQKQSYRNIEVIMINDGSEDNSGDICDRYAEVDKRFRVIHQKNRGVSTARNIALDTINGKYILFADSDDWLDNRMLEKLAEKADGTGTDCIMCDAYNVYENGHDKKELRYKWSTDKLKDNLYYVFLYKSGVLWNKLIGQSCIRNASFDAKIRYGEDQLFLHCILENICRFSIVEEPLYYYRKERSGNVVSTPLNEKYFDWLKVKKLVISTLLEKELYYAAALSVNEIVYKINCAAVWVPMKDVHQYKAPCKELLIMCNGQSKWLLYESKGKMQGIKQYLGYKVRKSFFTGTVLLYKLKFLRKKYRN